MTNTWDYRFAFYIETTEDVPPEFKDSYKRLVELYGRPLFALFSPAVEEYRFLFVHWLPPRLILLFSELLAVLSLETTSDHIQTLEWSHEELLGYGQADFLLNCWFTFYPGLSGDEGVQIRFPARAFEKFTELARVLRNWLACDGSATNLVQLPLPGLPKKFLSFLETHSKLGQLLEFFFQPVMDQRGKGQRRWSNLLLVTSTNGIVVLADEYLGESSEYGIEMTHLPLQRVRLVDWTERQDGRPASIRVILKGTTGEYVLTWPVFLGLKPYALRWLRATESLVAAMERDPSALETITKRRGEDRSDSSPMEGQDHRHAKFGND